MDDKYHPSGDDSQLLLAALEILLGEYLAALLLAPPPSPPMPEDLKMVLWTIHEMPSMIAGQSTAKDAKEAWEWIETQEGLLESARKTATYWSAP